VTTTEKRAAPEASASSGKLAFLDGLRGWASLWVVFNHIQHYLDHSLNKIPAVIRQPLIMEGGMGVPIFFVISGYVISRSLAKSRMDGAGFRNFCARRWTRLTPPYYASLVLAVVNNYVSTIFKHENFVAPTFGNVLAHLVYIPDLLKLPLINGVHWTLYIEMQFYLLLAVLMWLLARKAFERYTVLRHVLLAAVAVAALNYPVLDLLNGREHYFYPYVCAFVSGCFIYWLRSGLLHPAIFAGYTVILGVGTIYHHRDIYLTCFIAHMLVFVADRRPPAMSRWLSDRFSQFLGHISYSLYLTHSPILGSTFYFGSKIFGDSAAAELALIPVEVAVAILVGYIAYRLVERPAIAWSQRLRPASPRMATA
jgi:peptidoglycan/LPS O-acetylase OafA/YrhL